MHNDFILSTERLALALDELTPEDGFRFERFANAFLTDEFPDLRPVGGIHDGGRDAFVYQPHGEPTVFAQSSVTEEWTATIRRTLKSLAENHHDCRTLVYCSPHPLQSYADELKRELRSKGIGLDIRDRPWFLAVYNSTPSRQEAAAALAEHKVDPLLAERRVTQLPRTVFTSEQEYLATAYLQIAIREADPDKSLTRLCYDAFIVYAMRHTAPNTRMSRTEIHSAVRVLVPSDPEEVFHSRLDGALEYMLRRRRIRGVGTGDSVQGDTVGWRGGTGDSLQRDTLRVPRARPVRMRVQPVHHRRAASRLLTRPRPAGTRSIPASGRPVGAGRLFMDR